MTLKQIEKLLTDHLIQSTGITTRLSNIEDKLKWLFYLVAGILLALVGNFLRGTH